MQVEWQTKRKLREQTSVSGDRRSSCPRKPCTRQETKEYERRLGYCNSMPFEGRSEEVPMEKRGRLNVRQGQETRPSLVGSLRSREKANSRRQESLPYSPHDIVETQRENIENAYKNESRNQERSKATNYATRVTFCLLLPLGANGFPVLHFL